MEKVIRDDQANLDAAWANASQDFKEFESKGSNATLQETSMHDHALMRSERSDVPSDPTPSPKTSNLMRRERRPPALVEVDENGDTYELIQVPEGKETPGACGSGRERGY